MQRVFAKTIKSENSIDRNGKLQSKAVESVKQKVFFSSKRFMSEAWKM